MSTAAGEVQPGPKGGNGVSCGSLPIIVFHGLIRKTIAVNVNFERGRPGALVPTGPYDIFWTFSYLLPPPLLLRWRDMDGKSETRFMHDVGECFISVLVLGA